MKTRGRNRGDDGLSRKLKRLQEMLLLEAELPEIWDYFQDFLATDAAFIDAGVRVERPGVPRGFEDILKEMEPKGKLSSAILTRLESHALLHGCVRWGLGYAFFLLFEEIEQGFCVYSSSLTSSIEYAQFTIGPLSHPLATSPQHAPGVA